MKQPQQDKDLYSSDDEYQNDKDFVQNYNNKNAIKSTSGRKQTFQCDNEITNEDFIKYNVFFHDVIEIFSSKIFGDNKLQKQVNKVSHKDNNNKQNQLKFIKKQKENIHRTLKQLQIILVKKLKSNDFIVADSFAQNKFKNSNNNKKIPFNFKLIRSITTYEIVEIFCQLGPYSKKFTVFNSVKQNHIHYCCKTMSLLGSQSTVYTVSLNKQNYVVKCISFKGYRKIPFHIILKQFFIASLMSALKIGPQIKRIDGFDLCVYPGCVEFAMQMCSPFIYSQINQVYLKLQLFQMHALRISHNDIKPQNIQFSTSYNKPVFIDFGISELLAQHINKKTHTQYCGTMNFSSQQMLRLFSIQKSQITSGFVNLYGNDIYGLDKSIKFWKDKKEDKNKKNKKKMKKSVDVLFEGQCQQQKWQGFQTFKFGCELELGKVGQKNRQLAEEIESLFVIQNNNQNSQYRHDYSNSPPPLTQTQQLITTFQQIFTKLLITQDQKQQLQQSIYSTYNNNTINVNNNNNNFQQPPSSPRFAFDPSDNNQYYYDLEKQLFIQLAKCILYRYHVQWAMMMGMKSTYNYLHNHDKINQIVKMLSKNCPLSFAQKQLKYFAKTLKREFVEDQFHFLGNQIIRINEYNNYIDNKQSLQLQTFYKRAQQQCKQSFYYYNKKNNNKYIQNFPQKQNEQSTYSIERKFQSSFHRKYNKKQLIQILSNQQQSKEIFHFCLDIYIDQVIKCATFIQAQGVRSIDKIKIIYVMCCLLKEGEFKKMQDNQGGRWFVGVFFNNGDNSQNDKNNISRENNNKISYLPYKYGMNQSYYSVILFYNKLLSIFIIISSHLQSTTKKNTFLLYEPLMSNIFNIIKNIIILGFNYYSILKTLIKVSIKYVLHKKNLRKHLFLILLKQFIQLGELMNNYQTIIQITDQSIKNDNLMFVKQQYLNDKLLLEIDDLLGNEFVNGLFQSQMQRQQMVRKLSVVKNMWIFFNNRYAKANCMDQQLFLKLSSFQNSLKDQFRQLSASEQFLYFQLYEYQIQVIKDYNITYFVKTSYEYQRHSAFFMKIKRLFNILWFGEEDSEKYQDFLLDDDDDGGKRVFQQQGTYKRQNGYNSSFQGIRNKHTQDKTTTKSKNTQQQTKTTTTQDDNYSITKKNSQQQNKLQISGYKRFLNSKPPPKNTSTTTQQINKFLSHVMFHGLDYYILTNPVHHYRQNSLSSLQISLKSLFIIHTIIIESSISLYMHFSLRAKIMLQSNLFPQFAKLVQSFCCLQSQLYLPVETLICLIKDLRGYIKENTHQKKFDIFQTTRIIWIYAIKILQIISSKSQHQLKTKKYNEYFQLKYLQLLQQIHFLFLELINLQEQNSPIKVNYASAQMYKSRLQKIFSIFEQHQHQQEDNNNNIKIKIVNRYKIHKIRLLLKRKYEQLYVYSQVQRIQSMIGICRLYMKLFQNGRQQQHNINISISTNYNNNYTNETITTKKCNFLSFKTTITTTSLWRQKLQLIYAQLLPEMIPIQQLVKLWLVNNNNNNNNWFQNNFQPNNFYSNNLSNKITNMHYNGGGSDNNNIIYSKKQYQNNAFLIINSVFFIRKMLIVEYDRPYRLLKFILQFIQINYCTNTTNHYYYHQKNNAFFNRSQTFTNNLLQHSLGIFMKFCELINEEIFYLLINKFLRLIDSSCLQFLGFVFILFQEVTIVQIQPTAENLLIRLLKKVALKLEKQRDYSHDGRIEKYLQQYYLAMLAIKQCSRQNENQTIKKTNNISLLKRKLTKHIEKRSHFRRQAIKQFLADFILNDESDNNKSYTFNNKNKQIKIKKNKSLIKQTLLQKRINYTYVSINQLQQSEQHSYNKLSNEQKCTQVIDMVDKLNDFQLERIMNDLDVDDEVGGGDGEQQQQQGIITGEQQQEDKILQQMKRQLRVTSAVLVKLMNNNF